jgi:lipoyl(octanoyl) transferase
MNASSWSWMESPSSKASFNMAVDETLLLHAAQWCGPVLRFYSWSEPAASFGYFQKYETVSQLTHLRPLMRRCTGGGLVTHNADWTYSLVFPAAHPWYQLRAEESYHKLHQWIQNSLHRIGFECELAPLRAKKIQGACFAGPEKFDLVHNTSKIAGAAQRRTKHGLLIQGSIQPIPRHIERKTWHDSMLRSATEAWGVAWGAMELPAAAQQTALELDHTTYSQQSYLERRR